MELKFTDGMTLRIDGEFRILLERDGLYVVGRGMCFPADDMREAHALLAKLKRDTLL